MILNPHFHVLKHLSSSTCEKWPKFPMATEEPPSTSPDSSALFETLRRYDFSLDPDFQCGLSSILGHPNLPPSPEELLQQPDLVLEAQCFYYARKQNLSSPIDWVAYKSYLEAHPPSPSSIPSRPPETDHEPSASTTTSNSTPTSTPPPAAAAPATSTATATATSTPPAPYPLSFNHIIDLISRNEPIPGIEQIPDTVLSADLSQASAVPKRRKPWEKESDSESGTGETEDAVTRSTHGADLMSERETADRRIEDATVGRIDTEEDGRVNGLDQA